MPNISDISLDVSGGYNFAINFCIHSSLMNLHSVHAQGTLTLIVSKSCTISSSCMLVIFLKVFCTLFRLFFILVGLSCMYLHILVPNVEKVLDFSRNFLLIDIHFR